VEGLQSLVAISHDLAADPVDHGTVTLDKGSERLLTRLGAAGKGDIANYFGRSGNLEKMSFARLRILPH